MSRQGYLRDKAKPWRSGHCNPSNPAEIHRQCSGVYQGRPCICDHHQAAAEPVSKLDVYKDVVQGTDEWEDLRRGIVTASVVADLITPSTLKTANNDTSRGLTARLVAERITGHTDPTYMSDDMYRGVEMEPYARDVYSGHYQQAVECGFMRRTGPGWVLGYSPDGVVGVDGLVEIKAPRAKSHLATILADQVPARYTAQLQAGLLVSGRAWIDYVSFCGGMPLYVKRVTPDPDWFAAIEEAASVFEAHAAEMCVLYRLKTKDMPATERVGSDLGLVF